MHIEQLVTMANDIAAFFKCAPDRDEAVREMATHLHRYGDDPRMREQIIDHCNAKGE